MVCIPLTYIGKTRLFLAKDNCYRKPTFSAKVELSLKANVHTRSVGQRPYVELQPTDHPLSVEQQKGITIERVQEIAEALLHPKDMA